MIKQKLLNKIKNYHIFPNIYPGKIKTGEGYFDCDSFFIYFLEKNEIIIDGTHISLDI